MFHLVPQCSTLSNIVVTRLINYSFVNFVDMRKKMFAIIAGGLGIAIASVPEAAHSGVLMN